MTKIKKSFNFDSETIVLLEDYAKRHGATHTEVIKRAVEQFCSNDGGLMQDNKALIDSMQAHIDDLQEQIKTKDNQIQAQQLLSATITQKLEQPKLKQGFFSRLFAKSESQNTSS
jgi:DNA replication initiation complex subunit (GINS family)